MIKQIVKYQCGQCESLFNTELDAKKCEKSCGKKQLIAPKIAQMDNQLVRLYQMASKIEDEMITSIGAGELHDLRSYLDEGNFSLKEIKKGLKDTIIIINNSMRFGVSWLIKASVLKDEVGKLRNSI